ncbi:hypothetical protein Bca101_066718 [Brassica carinata]
MAEVEELVLRGTVCGHNTDMVAAIATPFDNAKMTVTSSRHESIPIETKTKISDLPVNLVEEILSWVPLKYMREVRSTCKEWEALSKSRSFSKMHIDKLRSGESMMIAAIDYNLYLMKWPILFAQHGVCLKGSTYWLDLKGNRQQELKDQIVCFDFTSETYRPLLLSGHLRLVLLTT